MDFDSVAKAGSMLGSGGVIVMNEDVCMVKALERLAYFYHEESCGQCTPCREGTGWLYEIIHRIEHGEGRAGDLELLDSIGNQMAGRTICALADAAVLPVRSFIQYFRDEFEYHIEHKKCKVCISGVNSRECVIPAHTRVWQAGIQIPGTSPRMTECFWTK
jgi:NADH-quinone oxidoreductase subunit F